MKIIKKFDEYSATIRLVFGEYSTSIRRGVSPNRIEENIKETKEKKKEEKFIAPTLDEIEKYIADNKLKNVNAKDFLTFFTESKWVDTKGNKVKNWKLKLLTWNNYDKEKQEKCKPTNYNNYEQRKYDNLDNLYANSKGG